MAIHAILLNLVTQLCILATVFSFVATQAMHRIRRRVALRLVNIVAGGARHRTLGVTLAFFH